MVVHLVLIATYVGRSRVRLYSSGLLTQALQEVVALDELIKVAWALKRTYLFLASIACSVCSHAF